MHKSKTVAVALACAFLAAGCVRTDNVTSPTEPNPNIGVDRHSVLAEFPAFVTLTPHEKDVLDAYMKRCPQKHGAQVYFDPLYRGFYADFSTITHENSEYCRVPQDEFPFIEPLSVPPFMPDRLVSIYDKLPPVAENTTDVHQIHAAAEKIQERKGCSVNQIESAQVRDSAIVVNIIAIPKERYLDKDPFLFLSGQDRDAVVDTLRRGIPVSFTLVDECSS